MKLFWCVVWMLPSVWAGTQLRYFRNTSCNDNQLGTFSNTDSRADTDCHVPPRNITKAIFVDNIDADCAIITYSDYACNPDRARRSFADKDMCFFSHNGGLLRSWRTVCGKEMISIAASWEAYRRTHVNTPTETPQILVITGTSYAVTKYTSLTSWTAWNATGEATWYSTVTKTGAVPIPTNATAGATPAAGGLDFGLKRWYTVAMLAAVGAFAAEL